MDHNIRAITAPLQRVPVVDHTCYPRNFGEPRASVPAITEREYASAQPHVSGRNADGDSYLVRGGQGREAHEGAVVAYVTIILAVVGVGALLWTLIRWAL